jgi:hypothetical protein
VSLAPRFRPLATKLLQNLSGGTTTYTRVTQGAYDPDSGTAGTSTTTATVSTYFQRANAAQWGEQAVTATSREALLSAAQLGFRPEPGDTMTEGTTVLTVERVQIISGGIADVLYRVLLKAG